MSALPRVALLDSTPFPWWPDCLSRHVDLTAAAKQALRAGRLAREGRTSTSNPARGRQPQRSEYIVRSLIWSWFGA